MIGGSDCRVRLAIASSGRPPSAKGYSGGVILAEPWPFLGWPSGFWHSQTTAKITVTATTSTIKSIVTPLKLTRCEFLQSGEMNTNSVLHS